MKMWTTKDLMNRWKCDRRKVDFFCFEGLLKFKKSGRMRLFIPKDVIAFEKKRIGVI